MFDKMVFDPSLKYYLLFADWVILDSIRINEGSTKTTLITCVTFLTINETKTYKLSSLGTF